MSRTEISKPAAMSSSCSASAPLTLLGFALVALAGAALAVCARYHVGFGNPGEALALLTPALERFPENTDLKRQVDHVRDLVAKQEAPQ